MSSWPVEPADIVEHLAVLGMSPDHTPSPGMPEPLALLRSAATLRAAQDMGDRWLAAEREAERAEVRPAVVAALAGARLSKATREQLAEVLDADPATIGKSS